MVALRLRSSSERARSLLRLPTARLRISGVRVCPRRGWQARTGESRARLFLSAGSVDGEDDEGGVVFEGFGPAIGDGVLYGHGCGGGGGRYGGLDSAVEAVGAES